jgi:hypothetical protein
MDNGRRVSSLPAPVTRLVHLRTAKLSPRTSRLRVTSCREGYEDRQTVRSAPEGVVASVHIRKVEGRSPRRAPARTGFEPPAPTLDLTAGSRSSRKGHGRPVRRAPVRP